MSSTWFCLWYTFSSSGLSDLACPRMSQLENRNQLCSGQIVSGLEQLPHSVLPDYTEFLGEIHLPVPHLAAGPKSMRHEDHLPIAAGVLVENVYS